MDNFEWARGYGEKLGVYYVDFNDTNRPRIPKASARYLYELFKNNGFIQGSYNDPKTTQRLPFRNETYYGQFSANFSFGVSSVGLDIPSQVNDNDRGKSVWDTIAQTSTIAKHFDSSTDIAKDISDLLSIKAEHYYFTITWTRLLPTGKAGGVSLTGLNYYSTLIDQLLDAGIFPAVAINQWDYPNVLKTKGWAESSMIDEYIFLARTCFEHFGSKVKYWTTFSTPEYTPFTEQVSSDGQRYTIYKNLLLAHAKAYQLYINEFKATQKGFVGISLAPILAVPRNYRDPSHALSAERLTEYSFGLFADPIYLSGDYSDTVKKIGGSYLSPLSELEKSWVKGSADYFGLEYYNTVPVERGVDIVQTASADLSNNATINNTNPRGLRMILGYIRKRYNNVPVMISGNGLWDTDGEIEDSFRGKFIFDHVDEVLKAVRIDGSDVRAYTYRSLKDSYEWSSGYKIRFGLYGVNFDDPSQARTLRNSAKTFTKIVENRGILRSN
ncbi:lactase-phlorizin hydrolase [Biomphalaria pfeifferi]|uniref:Lactase-phlorizin hydrolase n=1 Tax=Biomphalaria pfeifferi TaxID=112525 RepID=A0AAD8BXK1_BIOPF|nr:lactase-phlorizin hydrolase [Biomphalaria pfeifferi]